MTAPQVETRHRAELPDDLFHWVCCDTNVAICGEDVTDAAWSQAGIEIMCPLCALLENDPCPKCGE